MYLVLVLPYLDFWKNHIIKLVRTMSVISEYLDSCPMDQIHRVVFLLAVQGHFSIVGVLEVSRESCELQYNFNKVFSW